MSTRSRHASLTRQLVLPVVGLVLAAVLANVGFSAWLAARRSAEAARAAQQQVADALRTSRVSLSATVLDALHRLTGSHFLVWEESARRIGLSTLPPGTREAVDGDMVAAALRAGGGTFGGQRYRVGPVRSEGVRPETVLILTPERSFIAATFEAVWPVLAVAAGTLAVLVPLGLRTTGRLAARIKAVERHVARIAEGEFGHTLAAGHDAPADDDEISRLVNGVNHMSMQLKQLRGSLVAGERQRLLGQLAAGFAHELRNAVTGARLAIDLHRRRCPAGAASSPPDDSLVVAARQLDILEEEVRGLLALAKPSADQKPAPEPILIDRLLAEVRDLTAPRCDHAGVQMHCHLPTTLSLIGRHDALRAALVNLALNGIDAAGRGGGVWLSAISAGSQIILAVDDSGAGPSETVRESMHEPFVTSKPEGIGLGLAVAKSVAEEHGGTLAWERHDGRTRFAISLPAQTLKDGGICPPAPSRAT
jgi:signal transduction histidine kinase